MKLSALLQIPGYVFFVVFFCIGFAALGTGHTGLLALAYIVLGISALFACLSFFLNAKGL